MSSFTGYCPLTCLCAEGVYCDPGRSEAGGRGLLMLGQGVVGISSYICVSGLLTMSAKGRPCLFNPGTQLMDIGAAYVGGHSQECKAVRRQVSCGWDRTHVWFCSVSLPEGLLPHAVKHWRLAKWRCPVTCPRQA